MWGRGRFSLEKKRGEEVEKTTWKREGYRVKNSSGVVEKKMKNSDNKKCRIRVK